MQRELGTPPARCSDVLKGRPSAGIGEHRELVVGVGLEKCKIRAHAGRSELEPDFAGFAHGRREREVESGLSAGTIGELVERGRLEAAAP